MRKYSSIARIGSESSPIIRQISGLEMSRIFSGVKDAVLEPYRGDFLWEDEEMKVYRKACRVIILDRD